MSLKRAGSSKRCSRRAASYPGCARVAFAPSGLGAGVSAEDRGSACGTSMRTPVLRDASPPPLIRRIDVSNYVSYNRRTPPRAAGPFWRNEEDDRSICSSGANGRWTRRRGQGLCDYACARARARRQGAAERRCLEKGDPSGRCRCQTSGG
ncbi:unnamed protein product [Rangifer tarandus platyrhynchus]|uniref:Uncharacterized protein n=1 Tax=Rangifer tarandus platyrhynchus TaxID=3082113 RepID=A0ABN8YD67_RANTA|nr:unnamed protein product [Rangifer tarandus platyrhynchus]